MPREVRLIVEPCHDRDFRGYETCEQQATGTINTAASDVAVRRNPIRLGEHSYQMARVRTENLCGLSEGEGLREVLIE